MTNKELIRRFFNEEPCEYATNTTESMMIFDGVLYSYGKHFWLARYNGTDRNHVKHFTINRGCYRHDPRYSPRGSYFGNVRMGAVSVATRKHQADVCKYLYGEALGVFAIETEYHDVGGRAIP